MRKSNFPGIDTQNLVIFVFNLSVICIKFVAIKFDIITIFPSVFEPYFSESIIKRARNKGLVKIKIHNLRDYTYDKHKTVDDKPFGGGVGMIVKLEPIYKAISSLTKLKIKDDPINSIQGHPKQGRMDEKLKIILFSAKGRKFDQAMARRFSRLDRLIMICGRYEGVDERVAKHIADYEISVGDYVLTGGELPAMVVVDAVSRLIPGVINPESLEEESFTVPHPRGRRSKLKIENCLPRTVTLCRVPSSALVLRKSLVRSKLKIASEYPQYTRPAVFSPKKGVNWRVPKVLLSGDHKEIGHWRQEHISERY